MNNSRIKGHLLAVCLLLAAVLAGCAGTNTISGDLYYRERIALPPESA
jgi:uncharacterized lipoprotein YbaY